MDEDEDEDEDVSVRADHAIRAGDWDTLRLLLHPYLHWTGPDGGIVRGRLNVAAAGRR